MKSLAILALCVLFATALSDEIPNKLRQRLRTASEKCQSIPSKAVNEDDMKAYKLSRGEGRRPENLGPHSLCITKEMGWQNEDGTINRELLMREKMRRGETEEKASEMMNRLMKFQKKSNKRLRLPMRNVRKILIPLSTRKLYRPG
ncbi:unnamed protein product [Ceutorhynchus assimilis]|uniref:Uncharacterized protein n=1 Tax=Ceutorhynchus assimilis TaxID=467358 RepID=A0A9N9MKV9_9CUCU|nr:unnamed protein product [Ceutorhynchus assimilis]